MDYVVLDYRRHDQFRGLEHRDRYPTIQIVSTLCIQSGINQQPGLIKSKLVPTFCTLLISNWVVTNLRVLILSARLDVNGVVTNSSGGPTVKGFCHFSKHQFVWLLFLDWSYMTTMSLNSWALFDINSVKLFNIGYEPANCENKVDNKLTEWYI